MKNPHPDWSKPVDPRCVECPSCRRPLHFVHNGGGHYFTRCGAFRKSGGRRYQCHVLTGYVIWVFRDADGVTYAVRLSKQAYELLCVYEAAHGTMPEPTEIARHVKEAA
jgi:hypothetical protein